jgi:hypothetical protein
MKTIKIPIKTNELQIKEIQRQCSIVIRFAYNRFNERKSQKEIETLFQMSKGILQILENEGNIDDLVAFMQDKNLPVDEIEARAIAEEIMRNPPMQGYLTISNALQWRLQYGRVIQQAGSIKGIHRVR